MKKIYLKTSRHELARTLLTFFSFLFIALSWSSVNAEPAKVALIHSNPVLGDVDTNLAVLESHVEEAFLNGANIVVTPEMATTGFSITMEQVLIDLGFTLPYPELKPYAI